MRTRMKIAMMLMVVLLVLMPFSFGEKRETAGLISSPYEFDQTPLSFSIKSDLPSKFSLVKEGRVTPIRNQGERNVCWSFASMASIESLLAKQHQIDLSEDHLIGFHGFNQPEDKGGNRDMATAYFARWQGPVMEAADPYDGHFNQKAKGAYRIKEVAFIPDKDYEAIKTFVYEKGAVYSTIYAADENPNYYNESTGAQYHNGNEKANHAISIVGWDDDYPKENFGSLKPTKNGAFLVRNSWGADWGNAGYFYVSYEDVHIGKDNMCVTQLAPAKEHQRVYDHSFYNATGQYNMDSIANVFKRTSQEKEDLTAIGIHINAQNTGYQLYVVDDFKEASDLDQAKLVAEGTFLYPGYHVVDIEKFSLSGSQFGIVAILSGTYSYPAAVEYAHLGYSDGATANPGESFYYDGARWMDAYNLNSMNFTIKGYTEIGEPQALDKTRLQKTISEAKALWAQAPSGIGYPKADLDKIIAEKEGFLEREDVSQSQIDAQEKDLKTAIDSYKDELDIYQKEKALASWSQTLQVKGDHVFKITFNRAIRMPGAQQVLLRNPNREKMNLRFDLSADGKVLSLSGPYYEVGDYQLLIQNIQSAEGHLLKTNLKAHVVIVP